MPITGTVPPVENVAQLQLLMQCDQGPLGLNSLYFRLLTGWTATALENGLQSVEDNWLSTVGAVTSNQVSLTGARIRDIGVAPWGPVYENLFTAIPGAVITDPAPFFAAPVVQFFADTPIDEPNGPRRSYVRHFGVVEAAVTGNVVLSANRTAIDDAWTNFISAIGGDTASEQVIVSLTHNWSGGTGEYWSPEGFANPVGNITVRAALGRAASRAGTGP